MNTNNDESSNENNNNTIQQCNTITNFARAVKKIYMKSIYNIYAKQ